jgi:uncharacterized membrane protein YjjP (DUF1212 family)
MAKSTGPILAIGGITLANKSLLKDPPDPFDWRIVIATGVSAGMFALLEKGWERGAVAIAYLALVTILFVRVDPKTPAPVENLNKRFKFG